MNSYRPLFRADQTWCIPYGIWDGGYSFLFFSIVDSRVVGSWGVLSPENLNHKSRKLAEGLLKRHGHER